jgi:hypothetical protein
MNVKETEKLHFTDDTKARACLRWILLIFFAIVYCMVVSWTALFSSLAIDSFLLSFYEGKSTGETNRLFPKQNDFARYERKFESDSTPEISITMVKPASHIETFNFMKSNDANLESIGLQHNDLIFTQYDQIVFNVSGTELLKPSLIPPSLKSNAASNGQLLSNCLRTQLQLRHSTNFMTDIQEIVFALPIDQPVVSSLCQIIFLLFSQL